MKEQFLHPFPRTATDRVSCLPFCHFCLYNPHVNCNPPQWLASGRFYSQHKSCLLLVDRECLSVCAHHVISFRTTAVMSPLTLTPISLCFCFSVLLQKSFSIPLWFGLTVHQQFIFSSSNHYTSQEKNSYCPYITYGHTPLPSSTAASLKHASLSCLFSVFP